MSSRSSVAFALLAVSGCNQLFGSTAVEVSPPVQFDAPLDAPFACPPIGQTAQFSPYVHQFLARDCSFYGVAGDEAVAECTIEGLMTIVIGPVGGELVPVTSIAASATPTTPRISPDGQTLLARASTTTGAVAEYTRTGDAWMETTPDVFQLSGTGAPFSSIAQIGTTLRVLELDYPTSTLVEYERAAGTWSQVARTPVAQVLTDGMLPEGLSLTSDGLRLVIATPTDTRYSDRSSLAAAFRPAESLQAPSTLDVFVADDCSRIYLSGLGSIFYAQRQ